LNYTFLSGSARFKHSVLLYFFCGSLHETDLNIHLNCLPPNQLYLNIHLNCSLFKYLYTKQQDLKIHLNCTFSIVFYTNQLDLNIHLNCTFFMDPYTKQLDLNIHFFRLIFSKQSGQKGGHTQCIFPFSLPISPLPDFPFPLSISPMSDFSSFFRLELLFNSLS